MAQYLRKIGIDFGTSTSVICYRDYRKEADGTLAPAGEAVMLKDGTVSALPTMIIEKDKNEGVQQDLFAQAAYEAIDPETQFEINFKMDLFNKTDEARRKEAIRLVEKYFGFLHGLYEENKHLTVESEKEYEIQTCVSFPVRAEITEQDYILNAAKKAGFKNVASTNEVRACLQCAMESKDSPVRRLFEKHHEKDIMNILMLDMGAGTTDIALSRYRCGESMDKLDEIASWPDAGEARTLGGREIDQKLFDYFNSLGIVDDEYITQYPNFINLTFKKYKERSVSLPLADGMKVNAFGAVRSVLKRGIRLDDHPKLCFTRATFEQFLADDIAEFVRAVKAVVAKKGCREEEIDFVILAGGHSRWYFLRQLFEGKPLESGLPFPPLDFVKIREDPERLIAHKDPQLMVAKGLVSNMKGVDYHPISKHKIWVTARISTENVTGAGNPTASFNLRYDLLEEDLPLPVPGQKKSQSMQIGMFKNQSLRIRVAVCALENGRETLLLEKQEYIPRMPGVWMENAVNQALKKLRDFADEHTSGTTLTEMIDSQRSLDEITEHVRLEAEYRFNESENLSCTIRLFCLQHWNQDLSINIH